MGTPIEEIIILMNWHYETDQKKILAYEANRKTFIDNNPGVKVLTVVNPYKQSQLVGPGNDLAFCQWYIKNKDTIRSKRYVLVGWDCWCDCRVADYFRRVWDCDLVVPSIKYPERDNWHWFYQIRNIPIKVRPYAVGVTPFGGIMISDIAMDAISKEIIKPEYQCLNSDLRLGTIATMLNFDPIVNPVYTRSIGWRTPSMGEKYTGLHQPRQAL